MFKRVILAIVTLFTFATPVALDATPVSAHNGGTHSSRCIWWQYTTYGSSTVGNYSAAANCAYNMGKRIFGSCLGSSSVAGVPENQFSGSFSFTIRSLSGGLCGQSQTIQSLWGGYVWTH